MTMGKRRKINKKEKEKTERNEMKMGSTKEKMKKKRNGEENEVITRKRNNGR